MAYRKGALTGAITTGTFRGETFYTANVMNSHRTFKTLKSAQRFLEAQGYERV